MRSDGWHGLYMQGGQVRGRIAESPSGGYDYQVMSAGGGVSWGGHHPKLETAMWEVEGGVQGQDGRARERKEREG